MGSNTEVAREIVDKSIGNKRNPIVDKFLEILEGNPEIEILDITENNVDWRFRVDSQTIREAIGEFRSYEELTDKQMEECRRIERAYQMDVARKVYSSFGMIGVTRLITRGSQ